MVNYHKKIGHLITLIQPGSIAEELDIEPGDYLLEVNGHTIKDVFDYRFEIQDDCINVLIRKTGSQEEWLLEIEKDYDQDIGIEFETSLMSDYKSCQNKCIFCFIDQMYPQWENGVGMVRSLIDEVTEELQILQNHTVIDKTTKRKLTIATGKMSFPTIARLSRDISNVFPNIEIQVIPIINHFFGETVTITGLITGQDLIGQLQQRQQHNFDIGEALLISSSMLRTGEQIFLDDLTTEDVSQRSGVKVCPMDSSGYDFVHAIVDTEYQMERVNDQFVYINAKPPKA